MKLLSKKRTMILAAIIVVLGGGIAGAYVVGHNLASETTPAPTQGQNAVTISEESQARIDEKVVTDTSALAGQTVDDRLLYLIEEEKLAHDVYIKMYELYGARTFDNISRSETQHQNSVLAILQDHHLADPRSSDIGIFRNQDLQKLYDSLIAQGSKSLSDAYAAGVTIEEVDIADLTTDLKLVASGDTAVVAMMNALKNGSENHLQAFSKHI